MKTLNNYIQEALIKKDTKLKEYYFQPTSFKELRSLIEQLLNERGKNADLNDIDVSKVTEFYQPYTSIFDGLDPHNIDISQWNVSRVRDMTGLFYNCKNFNCDLSQWKVNNVELMQSMFEGCEKFKGEGLENWKPIKCTPPELMLNIFKNSGVKKYPSWYKECRR